MKNRQIVRFCEAISITTLLLSASLSSSAQSAKISYGLSPAKPVGFDKLIWNVRVSLMEGQMKNADAFWFLENGFSGNADNKIQMGLRPADSASKTKTVFLNFIGVGASASTGNCKVELAGKNTVVGCKVNYDWQIGVVYKFVVELNGKSTQAGMTRWIATVVNSQTGETTQIGEVETPISWGFLKPSSSCYTKWSYPLSGSPCNLEAPFEIISSAPIGFSKDMEYHSKFLSHSEKNPCVTFAVIDEFTVMVKEK
jgi:hypothetical protein